MLEIKCSFCGEINYAKEFIEGTTCENCETLLDIYTSNPITKQNKQCFDGYICDNLSLDCKNCPTYNELFKDFLFEEKDDE